LPAVRIVSPANVMSVEMVSGLALVIVVA